VLSPGTEEFIDPAKIADGSHAAALGRVGRQPTKLVCLDNAFVLIEGNQPSRDAERVESRGSIGCCSPMPCGLFLVLMTNY
jgi:hypothetical protein